MAIKTYFNWSTGKDSALALYHLLRDERYSVERLLTSVNAAHDRISMHGLRRSLYEKQTAALKIPATTLELPETPSMTEYDSAMARIVADLKNDGFTCAAFGDIFLEDLRKYREDKLQASGLEAVFPIWKRDTRELIAEFISLGFKAVVVCVSLEKLDASFAGRDLNEQFVRDLPEGVDPCGENGEFHTFCYAGPIFSAPVGFAKGETVIREYPSPEGHRKYSFAFTDLI